MITKCITYQVVLTPKYNAYMGAYRLQWDMIQFAKEHNIDRYNFYGVTGDFE